MKILWVTNQATPEISAQLGKNMSVGGGWMNTLSHQVSAEHELVIVFPCDVRTKDIDGTISGINYYGIQMNKADDKASTFVLEKIKRIIKLQKPDIIHIWGTEYIHSWSAACACEELGLLDNVVVSIQGLVSIYKFHFWCGLDRKDFPIVTLRDLKFKSGITAKYESFIRRGFYEKLTLQKVKNVIGRTDWDEACVLQYNPCINYFFCNETLRESFYNNRWDLSQCKKHTVFVSQSQYPIKGFHMALEAIAILKRKWPDIKLITTGRDRIHCTKKELLKLGDYDLLIRKKIIELDLEKNVVFVGSLDEQSMCKQYTSSHVFLSPSSIENSPNSVGEAMLLGMPVVTSDVGGVKNMLSHNLEGYIYQYDAPYMAAYYIDKIFSDDPLANSLGEKAYLHAKQTHDWVKNYNVMMSIYESISKDANN